MTPEKEVEKIVERIIRLIQLDMDQRHSNDPDIHLTTILEEIQSGVIFEGKK